MTEQFEDRPLVTEIHDDDLILVCLHASGFAARPCTALVTKNYFGSNGGAIPPVVVQRLTEIQERLDAMDAQRLVDLASQAEKIDLLQAALNQLTARVAALEENSGGSGFNPPQLSGMIDLRSHSLAELRLTSYEAFFLDGSTAQNSDFLINQDSQVGLKVSRTGKNWNGVVSFSNVGGFSNHLFEMIVGYEYENQDSSTRVQCMPGLIDSMTELASLRDNSALSLIHLGQWLDARGNRSASATGLKAIYWKAPTARRGFSFHDPISGTELPLASGEWAKLSYYNGGVEGELCRLVKVTGGGSDLFAQSEETSQSLEWYSRNPNRAEYLNFSFPVYQTVEGVLRILALKVS